MGRGLATVFSILPCASRSTVRRSSASVRPAEFRSVGFLPENWPSIFWIFSRTSFSILASSLKEQSAPKPGKGATSGPSFSWFSTK